MTGQTTHPLPKKEDDVTPLATKATLAPKPKGSRPRPPKPTHRWLDFMEEAMTHDFDPNLEWPIQKHLDCIDDLRMGFPPK